MTLHFKWSILSLLLLLFTLVFIGCDGKKGGSYPLGNSYETSGMQVNGMVKIPAGILNMGGDNEQADRNEFPKHKVEIASFLMDRQEVTNAEFLNFTTATNYITVAERAIDWEEMKKQLSP